MPMRKRLADGSTVVYARPTDPRPDAKPKRPIVGEPYPDTAAGWEAAIAVQKAWEAERRPEVQWTVDRLLDEWLAWGATENGWQATTIKLNTDRVRAFRRLHGPDAAEAITREHARAYVREAPRSHRPGLRAAFEWARLEGKLITNVWDATAGGGRGKRARNGEIVQPGRNALTDTDVAQLCHIATTLHGDWHGSMIGFCAYTGVRGGEAYAGQPAWLRLDAGRLDVLRQYRSNAPEGERWALPKGDKARYDIVLLDEAREALDGLDLDAPYPFSPPRQGPGDKPHFDRRTHFFYWNAARAAFETQLPAGHWLRERIELARARGLAGQEGGHLKFHELRHTFATLLLDTPGVTREQVALMLGDTVKEVERTYGHAHAELAAAHITRMRDASRERRVTDLSAARARRA
jgi:integrase